MTKTPEKFADHPERGRRSGDDPAVASRPDLLSGVLRSIRLRGERIFYCAPVAPFAVSLDHRGGTIHIIKQGTVELQIDSQRRTHRYEAGDLVLLPAGAAHLVRGGRGVTPTGVAEVDAPEELLHPGTGTRWLSGTFSFEDSRGGRLLHALPSIIDLRGAQNQSLEWLDVSTKMLVKEKVDPSEGSAEMISRILDLLFIQALRAWSGRPDATAGWLTGATDRVIGDAISAIHTNPRYPWTVQTLAGICNLSRSAFSERFVRTVGQAPAAYLTQVRLDSAADLLGYTTETVGAIASEVGYASEAAFSRAFSKRFGTPPSRWRHDSSGRQAV